MVRLLLKNTYFFSVVVFLFGMISCKSQIKEKQSENTKIVSTKQQLEIVVGANNTDAYLPLLRDKNIAIVANQTSVLEKKQKIYQIYFSIRFQFLILKIFDIFKNL